MKQIIIIVLLLMCASFAYAQRKNNNNQKQQVTTVDSKRKAGQDAAAKKREEAKLREQARQEQLHREQARREEEERHNVLHWDDSQKTLCFNERTYNMIYVQGGTFTMGATPEQDDYADNDEKPVRLVTLSSYYIGKCEVTQELWQSIMGSNPSTYTGSRRPVEGVSWNDCQTFISKLNSLTGKRFRLPTEAEWEFASRGGVKSQYYKYSGSNTLSDVAWYADNSGSTTHDVCAKSPNELGLYDMSGNVWEWCGDWYGNYSSRTQTNPTGVSNGSNRVFRGGSWYDSANGCRVSFRNRAAPSDCGDHIGFRLVLLP